MKLFSNLMGYCYIKLSILILARTGMLGCSVISTPMLSTKKLFATESASFHDDTLFRSIVGALQYLTFTKPYISFLVNKLSQFMHCPNENHWAAVKHILRYLKSTSSYVLLLPRNNSLRLHGFYDADWGGNLDDRKSTTRFGIYIGSTSVSWSSWKQRSVSWSSTEVEYRLLDASISELIWI